MSFKEMIKWIFSGLNVSVSQCRLDSVGIAVQSKIWSHDTKQFIETATITSHNSSFGSLDLKPGTKALITECFIDAESKSRPTLITAKNSDVSIQNCHFEKFTNENDSTILFGHSNSHVTIKNSIFTEHRSFKGTLVLQNTSSMHISGSLITQNVATFLGFSPISLFDKSHAVVQNTMFRNNSALIGGAMVAINLCRVTLTNCTFFLNEAVTGKTLTVRKSPDVEMATKSLDNNGIFAAISATSAYRFHHLVRSSILQKFSGRQNSVFIEAGAVFVAIFSQLLVTNCTFADNLAQDMAGAISTGFNVTLDIQETTFVGNEGRKQGGAINAQQTHLRVTNCAFDHNRSEGNGGAISALGNVTLDIKESIFTRNRATQGGAIDVGTAANLLVTDCTFKDNRAEQLGGAVCGSLYFVSEINGSYFYNNTAVLQGGVINVQENADVIITNSTLERNVVDMGTAAAIYSALNVTLKIRETNFTGNTSPNKAGALEVSVQCHCHVELCVFHNNTAKNAEGGAIYIGTNSFLQIENANFTSNNGSDGGAIYIDSRSKLQTKMCNYWENFATQAGGAIELRGYSTAVIENCRFLGNHAVSGGAMDLNAPEHVFIRETLLLKNVASSTGGAITIIDATNVLINNITCIGNQGAIGGGCLGLDDVRLTLNNSEISENVAHDAAGVTAMYSRIQVEVGLFLLN